jgi:hypothetical protein
MRQNEYTSTTCGRSQCQEASVKGNLKLTRRDPGCARLPAVTVRRRSAAMRTFTVRLERTVILTATVEVEAADADQAEALAKVEVDKPRANYWREDTVEDERTLSIRVGVEQ